MTTISNPLPTPASLSRAVALDPVAPHWNARSRRAAANHRRGATPAGRAARTLPERELFARYHGRGDLGARDELVARFLPLARC